MFLCYTFPKRGLFRQVPYAALRHYSHCVPGVPGAKHRKQGSASQSRSMCHSAPCPCATPLISGGFPGPLPAHPDACEADGHAAWHAEEALPGDPRRFDIVWRVPHQQLVWAILRFIRHRRTARNPVAQIVIPQPMPLRVGQLLHDRKDAGRPRPPGGIMEEIDNRERSRGDMSEAEALEAAPDSEEAV